MCTVGHDLLSLDLWSVLSSPAIIPNADGCVQMQKMKLTIGGWNGELSASERNRHQKP